MPDRVEVHDVTCPALTTAAAPVEVDISSPRTGIARRVTIVIPDGHAGLTGIQLCQAHQQVLPANLGAFISGNDEEPVYELADYLNNGNWQVRLMNGDSQPHEWEIRLEFDEVPHEPSLPPASDAAAAGLAAGVADLSSPDVTPPDLGAPDTGTGDTGGTVDTGGGDGGTGPPVDTGGDTGGTIDQGEPPPPPDTGGDVTPPDEITPPDVNTLTPPDVSEPSDTGDGGGTGANGGPDQPAAGGATGAAGGQPSSTPSGGAGLPRPGQTITTTRWVTKYKTVPVYKTVVLPAGGWLPEHARFTIERIDQGQDFITDWRGEVIAPGDGYVLEVKSDKPFPDGFGPAYPVLRVTSGRWAGGDYYIGHCTTAVHADQRFHQGDVLAHADQGHVSGGGWVELGPASALGAGIHGQGAQLAGKWGNVSLRVKTGEKRVPYRVRERTTTRIPRNAQPIRAPKPGAVKRQSAGEPGKHPPDKAGGHTPPLRGQGRRPDGTPAAGRGKPQGAGRRLSEPPVRGGTIGKGSGGVGLHEPKRQAPHPTDRRPPAPAATSSTPAAPRAAARKPPAPVKRRR